MLESQFDKVTGLYPAISLKQRTPTQVFSGEFCEILKNLFYRTPPGDYFCSTEKIFCQQNSKERSEKRENIETACKKNNHTGKTKT